MSMIDDVFNRIDSCNNVEEIEEIDKFNYGGTLKKIFWESFQQVLEAGTVIERKKGMAKCHYINRLYGSNIPITNNIQPFRAPYGFYGIHITAYSKIGTGCTLFPNVVIGGNTLSDSSHGGFPTLGNNVYIGPGATIIGNVHIGNNVRIGAGCFVAEDVKDNCTIIQGKPVVIMRDNKPNNKFLWPKAYQEEKKRIGLVRLEDVSDNPCPNYPNSIVKTCSILGWDLPSDASKEYIPSEYIHGEMNLDWGETKEKLRNYLSDEIYQDFKTLYEKFKRKFRSQNIPKTKRIDFDIWFCDWILFAKKDGYTEQDYFDYEFYNKSIEERRTFLSGSYRSKVRDICNDKSCWKICINKGRFNKTYHEFVHRDWMDSTKEDVDTFRSFINRHGRVFVKPIGGTGGKGARIIDIKDCMDIEGVYKQCQDDKMIIEEIVEQHDSLKEYNADTLNTLRVYTILDANNTPHITMAFGKFGRKGNFADNFHSGGLVATINPETGMVVSDGLSRAHERYVAHPDSGKKIKGFQYPCWEKLKDAVKGAALKVPQLRSVGWDIAITATDEIEFIEGNSHPNFDAPQAADQIGRFHIYKPLIDELEKEYTAKKSK